MRSTSRPPTAHTLELLSRQHRLKQLSLSVTCNDEKKVIIVDAAMAAVADVIPITASTFSAAIDRNTAQRAAASRRHMLERARHRR
mmetsp:Transcript_5253/g.14093  ORF Transcript_5253/g.14093 Transcript_5253/m.14093 type:complete len:86 (-) Transcript_5253:1954-2211(-)